MNPILLLYYSVTRNAAGLQRLLQQREEQTFRQAKVRRDASGKPIFDQATIERIQRRQSQPPWVGGAIGLLFVFATVAVCNASITIWHQAQLLREEGLTATGVVTKSWSTRDSHNVPDYTVSYKFEAGGRIVNGVAAVGKKTFYSLRPQGPVEIIYVRSDPSISFVKTSKTPIKDLPLAVTFACIWLLGSGVVVYCIISGWFKR